LRKSTRTTSLREVPSEILTDYVPPEVGPEIYAGSIIAVLPIIYASVLFYERIQTQRACLICSGTGLIWATPETGSKLKKPRKCYNCGGLLPWIGWNYFWFSTLFQFGNGGPIKLPSRDFEKNNELARKIMEEGGDLDQLGMGANSDEKE